MTADDARRLWHGGIEGMLVLQVRHHDASIQVTVKLSRFIADWPTAQQMFVGGMAEGFRDWHPIGPEDFTITPAISLADLRCRCQLFRGACSIVLAPDTLSLNFSNVRQRSQPEVMEVARRSLDWLSAALGEHGRQWMSFNTGAHMQAPDGDAVAEYLHQFVRGDIDKVLQTEPGAQYVPTTRMICAEERGRWVLRRMVEKSMAIDNGVFVDTHVHIETPDPARFDEDVNLLSRLDRLADRVVGLQPEESR